MALDFSKPATTDNYSTQFVPNIQANQTALAQWLDSSLVSITGTIPTGAKRYNATTGAFEQWNASSWVTLPLGGAFNGTVGATTPSTGAFTTLSASGAISNTGGSIAISGGTNPHLSLSDGTGTGYVQVYLGDIDITPRAGKNITLSAHTYVTGALSATGALTTAGLQEVSGNLGLGVTPSAWAGDKAVQVNFASMSSGYEYSANFSSNVYRDNATWRYQVSSQLASRYEQFSGSHRWYTAPTGTAGAAITFTQAMTLDASGNLALQTGKWFGTVAGTSYIPDDGSFGGVINNGGGFRITTGGTEALRVDTSHRVAINKTSANRQLDVAGGAMTTANALGSFSTTPTFDASLSNFHTMPAMTANVTSVTLSNAQEGQFLTLRFTQDGTGGRTITTGNMGATNAPSITGAPTTTANKASYLNLTYNATAARWEGSWLATA